MSEALYEGVGKRPFEFRYNEPRAELLADLHVNVGVFAAFKNHNMVREMAALLLDGEGNLRSWKEFKAEAGNVDDKYNRRWLRTEYDHAVTASRQAMRWKEIERTSATYPNLQYITVKDDRVRFQHRKWHGIILPIDHPFWRSHYPPNDWGCRCNVRRTKKPADTKGVDVDSMADLKPGFNINYGQAGKVFDKTHPYFDVPGFETVARFARNSLVNHQRNEILGHMKDKFSDGPLYVPMARIGKVEVSRTGLRKMLSDASENAYKRNLLAYDIERVLKEAVFITSGEETKGRFQNKQWLYYRVKGTEWIVVVREVRLGASEKTRMVFYSINDRLKTE